MYPVPVTDSAGFATPQVDDEEDLGDLLLEVLPGDGSTMGNQSAHDLMGDEVLMKMARELAEKLRSNLSIDWQYKENVRARLRTMIKALLKRYKYPPDQEAAAIDLVLQQTEMISEEWSREDLGNKIQAVVADALEKQF